jgi:hypothetical protein
VTVTKRIDIGRGHWYKLDGEKVDGVTTVISNGIPKPALMPWAAREVATYAADNLELLEQLDRDARIDLLKCAHYRDRDKAARRGTEVHALAERLIKDEEVDVPDELVGHVDSYLKFLDEFNPKPVLVEAVVGNRTHKWMGTIDLYCEMRDELWLLDIKTTRSGIYGEVALQLAAYANAEFYIAADGTETPMPFVERCGAIWVRADGYDLVPVVAGPDTYRTFRYAQQVAKWQTELSKSAVLDVISPIEGKVA